VEPLRFAERAGATVDGLEAGLADCGGDEGGPGGAGEERVGRAAGIYNKKVDEVRSEFSANLEPVRHELPRTSGACRMKFDAAEEYECI